MAAVLKRVSNSVSSISLVGVMLVFGALLIAVFAGLTIGTGQYILAAPIALILPAALLLARPDLCLIAMAGLTLLVGGSLRYFVGLGQLQWVVSCLGLALLFIAVIRTLFVARQGRRTPPSSIGLLFMLWWISLVFASLVNMVPMLDWFVGIRIFLPFLGVFAYIAYCKPSERLIRNLLLFLIAVATIQWIFCVYQKFVIVPQRLAGNYPGSPWDSVVGSFGGEKFGGGESGSLGVYLVIALTLAASLRKARQMRLWVFGSVVLFALAAVGLSESKVVVLLLPVGALIVYRDYVYRRPARFLLGCLLLFAAVLALLLGYHFMYWQSGSSLSFTDALVQRLSYSFDPNFKVTSSNLGRVGSMVFWWDKHSLLDNPVGLLVGHGLASAVGMSTVIGSGTAVLQYGYLLDTTGATKLLWETGLLGTAAFLAIFVLGWRKAVRLAANESIPTWHRAAMRGIEAAMVVMPLAVFYEVTVVSSPPMQFTAMLLLGYVEYWWRETDGNRRV